MDIVILGTSPVERDPQKKKGTPHPGKKVFQKDRRKNKQDRRKNAREGVIVSLSGQNDRRGLKDRRKSSSYY